MRHFYEGWRDEFAGLEFRVVKTGSAGTIGKACIDCQRAGLHAYEPCEHDLVLQVWIEGGGWRSIPMIAVAMMTEFFWENEDVLYPPPRFKGGAYFFEYLRDACERGYLRADSKLKEERRAKRQRVTA